MTTKEFNKFFDHTILKPPTTKADLKKVCDDAKKYGFCSVAVNTGMVALCAEYLKDSDVLVDAAVGFPLGITTVANKVFETKEAIRNGAGEIDYVVNIGKVKDGDMAYIKDEMEQIVNVCRQNNKICKVIFENCYLTDDEKIALCKVANEVKPDFVKTSTGFGPSSATVEDVALMRKNTDSDIKVKAAGGVRDLDTCFKMIEAGALRIGCSNSPAISEEFQLKNI